MIKVTEIVNRRPGMSVEDFQDHWLNKHGPIVAKLPGLRRYVQSHTLLGGYRRGDVPFDGIAELWFDDKQAMRDMATTPEFDASKADEPNFIDASTLIELVADEHVIKDGVVPPDAIKSIVALRFKDGMDPAEAQNYWKDVHGPLGAAIPTVKRYVQTHARLGAYKLPTPPPYDGLAITWAESVDEFRAGAETEAYRLTIADEPNFIGRGMKVILAKEHVFIDKR